MHRQAVWSSFLTAGASAFAAAALAQEPGELQKVEMRVVDSRPGVVTLDRGGEDGLRRGDRVLLRLRDGNIVQGTLTRVDGRGSTADLDDQSLVPPPGTRAEAFVPSARTAPIVPTEPAPPPVAEQNPLAGPPPEHAPWPEREDSWSQGQPLLARVRPLRVQERPSDFRGRLYSIFDYTMSSEDDRTDTFFRAGTDLVWENGLGRGERIQFDGEWNYRNTDVPDNDDQEAMHLRIDRASYSTGGNRFEPDRLEFGRFLQDNAPEFGLLDGIEWDRRLEGGDRFGLSAGFMPEPDPNQQSVQDFQLAGSYRWVYDESEQLSAAAGYQKSWHNAHTDRDLFLAQLMYLPLQSWTFVGTAWVDLYTSGDVNKDKGFELTQAQVTTGRRWENDNSLYLVYRHGAYAEVDRHEYTPVTAQQLADDHLDRVSAQARVGIFEHMRVHGLIAAWVDQDDTGTDGVGGLELHDIWWDHILLDLSAFTTQGKFVDVLGLRATLARTLERGRYGVIYELADSRFDGFTDANDDLPHHRLSLSAEGWFGSGWNLEGHLAGMLWDQESSIQVGFYLQRSF